MVVLIFSEPIRAVGRGYNNDPMNGDCIQKIHDPVNPGHSKVVRNELAESGTAENQPEVKLEPADNKPRDRNPDAYAP